MEKEVYLHIEVMVKAQGAHNLAELGERVNKGTKTLNSLPSSPLVISFTLRDFTEKAAAYKSCITLSR